MTDEKIRAALEEMRAFEKAHRLQGEGGNRSETEMADRLKRWADALSALTAPDGDVREQLIQLALAHLPILGVAGTGKIVGCRCMDRVFVRGQETWAEHIADAILATFPELSRAAALEPEWEYSSRAENGFLYEVTNLEDAELSARNSRQVHGYPGSTTPHLIRHVVRRRKAGPWEPLPVGGETDGELHEV